MDYSYSTKRKLTTDEREKHHDKGVDRRQDYLSHVERVSGTEGNDASECNDSIRVDSR